jgi:hypothetical protein
MLVVGLVCTVIPGFFHSRNFYLRQIIGGLVINLGGGPDHTRFAFI